MTKDEKSDAEKKDGKKKMKLDGKTVGTLKCNTVLLQLLLLLKMY